MSRRYTHTYTYSKISITTEFHIRLIDQAQIIARTPFRYVCILNVTFFDKSTGLSAADEILLND